MTNTDVKLEIYKDGITKGVLDMYSSTNFPLSLNFGVKNITNINATTGTYSKTIKIPATKNNNKLLKQIGYDQSVNIESFLDNTIECRVSLNNHILVLGSIQVKGIVADTTIAEYQITILGANVNWANTFTDEYMCDVRQDTFDNQTLYTWSNGLWKDINDNTNPPFDNKVWCLPVICWGEWKKDKWIQGNNYIKKMDLSEVRPAFFVRNLIKHYFSQIGYKVQSDFMDSDVFKKLIIPTTLADWNRDNFLGFANREIRAEFVKSHSVNVSNGSLNHNPEGFWIRRWNYNGNTPQAFQRGVNKLLPYDLETKDIHNKQTTAQPDLIQNQQMGFEYNQGLHGTSDAPYHKFVVPQSANYEIKAKIQVARTNHSQVYASVIVFRDCEPHPNPNSNLYTTTTQSIPHLVYSGHTNPLFASLCRGQGIAEPFQVGSGLLDNDLSHLDALDANSSYTHLEHQTLEIDTGDVYLQSGDIVSIFITNLESDIYLNNISTQKGFCWAISQDTNQFMGRDKFSRILKISNWTNAIGKTKFEVNRIGAVAYGDKFNVSNFLPCDIPKIDLIKAVTGMFNLYWNTDEISRVVYVEPYDNFYKPTNEAINFTELVDYNKPSTTKFLVDEISKELYFKYNKDSGDGYVDEIEKELEQEYHSLEVLLQDGFVDNVKELGNEVSAPTYMFEDWELTKNDNRKVRIPLIVQEYVEDIDRSTKPEPMETHTMRILSYEGMKSIGADAWGSWNWLSGGFVQEYPAASTFHPTDTTYNNLDFGDNAIDGLYKTYWQKFINKLNDSPRLKVVHMRLGAKQISELNLQKPIYLESYNGGNGSFWIINRVIDYKPTLDDSTKIELIQFGNTISGKSIIKKRKNTNTLGKKRLGTSTYTDTGIVEGLSPTGYKNKGLVVRANNKVAKNNGNIVLGNHLRTQKQNQILLGQFNKQDDDAILIIGGGSNENDRRNVLTVSSDGTVHLGENGGGGGMVTKDENGNIVDLYTEEANDTIIKVIKG